MAVQLPDGSTIEIASAYAASKTMSAVSNANPAVATLEASHGISAGEYFEITSGWGGLNGRVAKAGTIDTNDVPILGMNTTSTQRFPVGSGTGSVREVSTWQQITQILDLQSTGGDQQFTNYSFLESKDEFQIPSTRSPVSISFRVGDDQSLPHYPILQAADDDGLVRALRLTLPSGARILYNGYVTIGQTPSLSKGEIMSFPVSVSLVALPLRYAS